MGFWNDGLRSDSPRRSRRRTDSDDRHYSSRPDYTRSAPSFFSSGGRSDAGRSKGYSRARPRSGFMNKLRQFLRDVLQYMRSHPIKVFMLVIMPLLTGGALAKILAQFGVRLPRGVEQLMGGGARGMGGGDRLFARGGARDFAGGSALPGMGGGIGDSIGSVMNIAKMFL